MLIRYKDKKATLNNLYDIWINYYIWSEKQKKKLQDLGYENTSSNFYLIKFIYFCRYNNGNLLEKHWEFKTQEERDKVYNFIINNYFTDIEKLINDNDNDYDCGPRAVATNPNFIMELANDNN